ncbi:MAG: hypothetical protein HIU84_08995, partial [Acidobacteria bacterium]|nr:hypothetical protein [Acidobacteriota bacterium]
MKDGERRVALDPHAVALLTAVGLKVLVQCSAGEAAGFSDAEYLSAGANLVSNVDEVWGVDLVVKVKEPLPSEYGQFRRGLKLFGYSHLAAAPDLAIALQDAGVEAHAFETVREGQGLPLLAPMSDIAGRSSAIMGDFYLAQGSGTLLGGSARVPPARVAVIGMGVAGTMAALERNGNGPVHVLSAEDILSTSFEAGTVLSTGATSWPSTDSQLFGSAFLRQCPDVQWVPDKKTMLLYSEASDSPGREQIRSLRTKLNQLREQSGVKVIEITSALSGEGKSFIAANLAHALALHQERNVLLIDCDIRRGSLAGMLGTRTAPGLAEYLLGEESLESVTQHGS